MRTVVPGPFGIIEILSTERPAGPRPGYGQRPGGKDGRWAGAGQKGLDVDG